MGCGIGKWATIVRCLVPNFKNVNMVGLDILKENLFFCKKYGAYDDLVLADGRYQPFKEGAFNVSLASEIIEHLHKREGLLLLEELQRITTMKVVVTTPNLWMQQHPLYENGKPAAYSRHLSKWAPSEFRAMKYHVHGIGFKLTLPPQVWLIPSGF